MSEYNWSVDSKLESSVGGKSLEALLKYGDVRGAGRLKERWVMERAAGQERRREDKGWSETLISAPEYEQLDTTN